MTRIRLNGIAPMLVGLLIAATRFEAITIAAQSAQSAQSAVCPLHAEHMQPQAATAPPETHEAHQAPLARGERAMGFDQARTSHHFRLTARGGSIEVHVNNPDDKELRDQVIGHLREIREQFSRGDFRAPLGVHGERPPGVAVLERYARDVTYTFEPGELGGRVLIATENKQALTAIHEFLRYQIREHQTGDPLSIEGR